MDGPDAIGAPSGPIRWVGTWTAGELGGTGVNAGAASKPKEARFGAPGAAFSGTGIGALFAEASLAGGGASSAPTASACRATPINEGESLEGLRAGSFCDLTGPAAEVTEGSRSGRFGALLMRAKLTPIAAAAASAIPPAIGVQLRERGLVAFWRSVRGPIDLSTIALSGGSIPQCDRRVSRRGEPDLGVVDAEGGGA